jgi:hypothetical protein
MTVISGLFAVRQYIPVFFLAHLFSVRSGLKHSSLYMLIFTVALADGKREDENLASVSVI